MSNLFKRLFKSKSKFLLIILCLLGMVLSYSCTCRNPNNPSPNPDPTPKGDSSIFSLTEDEATNQANNLLIYSTKLSKTNSLVIVKYKEQADHLFSSELKVLEDGTTGLTDDMFEYNPQNGRLTLKNTGVDKVKVLTEGEIKEIKIEFTFKPTDTTMTNIKGQTVFTNTIQVVKTKQLSPKTDYLDAIKTIGNGGFNVVSSTSGIGNVNFLTETATANDSTITIKASGDADTGTLKTTSFKKFFNDDANNRNFDKFSSIKITDDGIINGTIATFTVQFTLKNKSYEFEVGNGTFSLNADITRNYQSHNTSKWEK